MVRSRSNYSGREKYYATFSVILNGDHGERRLTLSKLHFLLYLNIKISHFI